MWLHAVMELQICREAVFIVALFLLSMVSPGSDLLQNVIGVIDQGQNIPVSYYSELYIPALGSIGLSGQEYQVWIPVSSMYSLSQKKRTFNFEFFGGPPVGGGPKIHIVDSVNGSSKHAFFFR